MFFFFFYVLLSLLGVSWCSTASHVSCGRPLDNERRCIGCGDSLMLGAGGMRAGAVNRICIGCGGSHGTRAGEVTLDGRRTWREVVCSAAGGAKCGVMRDERRTLC